MPFQTTQTLIRTITTDSYCYVTKNYGPAGNNPVKNILGGAPIVGSIIGQKKRTTQCGKARAIETSSVRGLDAAEKLLISPSATLPDDARGGEPASQLVGLSKTGEQATELADS